MVRTSRTWVWAAWVVACVGCAGEESGTAVLSSTGSPAREIRVHYGAGMGNSIAIRGNVAPLNWGTGAPATWTAGDVWVWPIPDGMGPFECKPLLNDSKWSVGGNYKIPDLGSVDLYPFFGPSKGSLWTHSGFASPVLGNTRNLIVYLPPSYFENAAKHYPVLYMHDGQNLFQKSTAFGGVEWGVDETLNSLIAAGSVREVIVVGIDNTSNRIAEYTPMPDPAYGGGLAEAYLDVLEDSVMPFIHSTYRTLSGTKHTFLMGSSLGGLVSFHAGWTRSSVYGAVGAMSASFWWNDEAVTVQVEQFPGPKIPVKFYLDVGGKEGAAAQVVRMRNALLALGYQSGADLAYAFDPNGVHSEAAWAQRLPIALPFIVGTD